MTDPIGGRHPRRPLSGDRHDVNQDSQRCRQRHVAAQQDTKIAAKQSGAVEIEHRRYAGDARHLGDDRGAKIGPAERRPAPHDHGRREDPQLKPARAQEIGQAEKRVDHGIGLRAEVAQHRGELRQDEQHEEHQHAGRRQQDEARILQRVRDLAAQGFGPLPFVGEHLEDVRQLAGGLADLHQRQVDRREIGGMLGDRVGETLARQDAGADLAHDRAQPPDIAVVGEQLQPGVEARACLEKQRQVAGENRDVFRPRPVEECDRDARNAHGAFLGDRFDRDKAEILDAMGDFRRGRSGNRSVHELSALGHRSIAKSLHRATVSL